MSKSKQNSKIGKKLVIFGSGIGGLLLALFALWTKRRSSREPDDIENQSPEKIKTGKGLAAILSGSIGCFLMGMFAFLTEVSKAVKDLLTFYSPGGPLSGISTLAVIGWLGSWAVFYYLWRDREMGYHGVFITGMLLIGVGLVLMFPPVMEVFK